MEGPVRTRPRRTGRIVARLPVAPTAEAPRRGGLGRVGEVLKGVDVEAEVGGRRRPRSGLDVVVAPESLPEGRGPTQGRVDRTGRPLV